VYARLNELRLAREFAEKAVEIRLKVLGPNHYDTLAALDILSNILVAEKDPEYAKKHSSNSRMCSTCNKVRGC
jgi:hypothetical protein